MHRGYIKIWRKIEESGLLQMHGTLALFMYILMKATHKKIKVGTPNGVIDLDRGQYMSGRHKLAEAVQLSEREIRTCLVRLEQLCILEIKTTNRYSVYTIVNYDNYQDADQQSDQPATNKRPTDDQPATTKQEHKNISTKEHKKAKSPIGSRLSPDWTLPDDYGNWALEQNQSWTNEDIIKIAEKFKDYWISATGAKASKADWFATWRNWIRNQR